MNEFLGLTREGHAFSQSPLCRASPLVQKADLEGQQRVDLTRSPHRPGVAAFCACGAFPMGERMRTSGTTYEPPVGCNCGKMAGLLIVGAAVGAVGRGGRPCPLQSRMMTLLPVPLGTKDVWLARSVLCGRKRSGPFGSDFKSKIVSAISRCSTFAIDSKLRGCDLVSLRVDDIAVGGHIKDRATIIQHKTGRPVQFEMMEQTRVSLQQWLDARQNDRGPYVFPSRVHKQPHLTARQYARIVHGWIEGAGMESSAYGTHSMRRTKAAQIYRKTGNLRAVQLLLGHTKIESTVRYLGIEVDDALSLSEQVEL